MRSGDEWDDYTSGLGEGRPPWWESLDIVCPRCNGWKTLPTFSHIEGGVCFLCWGTGSLTPAQRDAYQAQHGRKTSTESDDPEHRQEVADMIRFAHENGMDAFHNLEVLRDRAFGRYRKALASIRAGRGTEVAQALEEWREALATGCDPSEPG